MTLGKLLEYFHVMCWSQSTIIFYHDDHTLAQKCQNSVCKKHTLSETYSSDSLRLLFATEHCPDTHIVNSAQTTCRIFITPKILTIPYVPVSIISIPVSGISIIHRISYLMSGKRLMCAMYCYTNKSRVCM